MNEHDVRALADLARLSLSDEQVTRYLKDFESILGYISAIKSVPLDEEIERSFHTNVVREDDLAYQPGVFTQDILSNAPAARDGYFEVAKIL